MSDVATARALLESLGSYGSHFAGDDVAHLEVSGNEADCDAQSTLEMITRIIARGHDSVTIRETGRLSGEGARAVLNSYLALRDDAAPRCTTRSPLRRPTRAGTSTARRSSSTERSPRPCPSSR